MVNRTKQTHQTTKLNSDVSIVSTPPKTESCTTNDTCLQNKMYANLNEQIVSPFLCSCTCSPRLVYYFDMTKCKLPQTMPYTAQIFNFSLKIIFLASEPKQAKMIIAKELKVRPHFSPMHSTQRMLCQSGCLVCSIYF